MSRSGSCSSSWAPSPSSPSSWSSPSSPSSSPSSGESSSLHANCSAIPFETEIVNSLKGLGKYLMFGRLFWSSRCLSVERGNRYTLQFSLLYIQGTFHHSPIFQVQSNSATRLLLPQPQQGEGAWRWWRRTRRSSWTTRSPSPSWSSKRAPYSKDVRG